MNTIEFLRAAMRRAGLDYTGPILADGRLCRFKAEGDHARNSWFVLHAGPPAAGAFGCWKRGLKETWCERPNGAGYSQAEWTAVRARWAEAEVTRQATEAELHAKARKTAAWILERSKPATDAQPYLLKKGVEVHGGLREYRGSLVIPLRDANGTLLSVQFIRPEGSKRFLTGGQVSGCFFAVCDKADGPLVIAEGYATAASVHEATGLATVAAMNAGNLKVVAEALRRKWTDRDLIIAADNDAFTAPGNVGVEKAREAARAVGARLAVPSFKDNATKPTDFNDLHALEGIAEVKRQVEGAAVPKESDAEAFSRLAQLSPADYDRQRAAEAERLGMRLATLDAEVEAWRPKTASNDTQGTAVELPEVAPWPEPVDGAEVLHEIAATFARYVVLPLGAADALALWTAHTHAFDAFVHTPRLNLFSPEKGCGKTTALDVLAALVPRPLRTESITAPVLFRLVERSKPTLLLDECDAYLDEAEELRGLLNAGHKRGAKAYRCEGEKLEVRGFNCFAPAALAGIGGLRGKLSTLHDRSVVVRLTRAKPGEIAARFDCRRTAHEHELSRKLSRWTKDNFEPLETADPVLPDGAFNRLADNWRPLFAVAEVAGGDWPQRAADAFAKLTSNDDMEAQGIGAMLLGDIAAVFSANGVDRLPSARLAEELGAVEGRPWQEYGKCQKPISPNQLARLLRRFEVCPRTVRDGKDTWKGYHLTDFHEAFERFLPQTALPNRHTVTTLENIGDSSLSEPSQSEAALRFENASSANENGTCDGVTVGNTPALAGALLL